MEAGRLSGRLHRGESVSWRDSCPEAWAAACLVAWASLLTGCSNTFPVDRLAVDVAAVADGAVIDPEGLDVRTLRPLLEFRLPDSVSYYRMDGPVALSMRTGNLCMLAVGDAQERAVHIFSLVGEYVGTIDGGGREPSLLQSVGDVAFGSGNELWVADGKASRLIAFEVPLGALVRQTQLPSLPDRLRPSSIWVSSRGTIFIHALVMPFEFVLALPAIEEWTPDGHFLRSWGALLPYPRGAFTATLNSGVVGGYGDSVFGLALTTAVLRGYGASGTPEGPDSYLQLPRLFDQPALEWDLPPRGAGGATERFRPVLVSAHAADFAMDDRGTRFVVLYMDPIIRGERGAGDRRSLLLMLQPGRASRAYFDVGGVVESVAASGSYLAAIVRDTAGTSPPRMRVVLYRNPALLVPLPSDECNQ